MFWQSHNYKSSIEASNFIISQGIGISNLSLSVAIKSKKKEIIKLLIELGVVPNDKQIVEVNNLQK